MARTLVAVASPVVEAFGRIVYAEFLRLHIPDMPPIRGSAPYDVIDVHDRKLADKLPPGYGKDFGERAYLTLAKKFGGNAASDIFSEYLSEYLVKFLAPGHARPDPERGLKDAENWVMKGLFNKSMDIYREVQQREKDFRSISRGEDEDVKGGIEIDLEDPRSFQDIEDILPPHRMRLVEEKLRRVHPDAPLYVELLMQGYNDREIIGDERFQERQMEKGEITGPLGRKSKLPHLQDHPVSFQYWSSKIKPKILHVLEEAIKEAA